MLEHRVQVLLDDERYQKVRREADRRGVSIGALIREAIDDICPDLERRRSAIDAILGAEPMDLPEDPAKLRAELDRAHDRVPA